MKQQFDGTKETSLAPRHFNGKYVYNQVKDINVTFGKNHKPWRKKAQSLERGSRLWKMMIRRGGKRNLFFGSCSSKDTMGERLHSVEPSSSGFYNWTFKWFRSSFSISSASEKC